MLHARITPSNVGAGNSGANIDMYMTLIKSTGDTIGKYNPKILLNSSFDTTLPAGTYYIGVDGVSNQNVSDYGSVGLYSLSGSVTTAVSAQSVLLKGDVKNSLNLFNWNIQPNDSVATTYLEYSFDGRSFEPIAAFPSNTTSYSHKPPTDGDIYYRVRMILPDETSEYSNTISLRNIASGNISLASNIVRNILQVRCTADFGYQLMDETGRLLQKGKLSSGLNIIQLNQVKQGLLLMNVFNQTEQLHFKLIKQ
jgi:hypothetical protein